MRADQKLMVSFEQFDQVLVKTMNDCIREPREHLAVFFIGSDAANGAEAASSARLEFIVSMGGWKFVSILTLDFEACSDETIRDSISRRYSAVVARCAELEQHLAEVKSLVRLKNPSLAKHLEHLGGSGRR
jgi:hypothetical protein